MGETERRGQVGETVRLDVRDTVARGDITVGQTLEAGLGPNHLMHECAYSTIFYYSNITQDLIDARKLAFWDFFIVYLNVATDDLYQKIARKLKN